MKNRYLFLLSINLLISTLLFSQYPDNVFKDYSPVWFHAVYDSTAIPQMNPREDNKIRFVNSILEDSLLYSIFEYNYKFNPDGGQIEKLNLHSGEPEWITNYDLRSIDINEKPNRMYINHKGELEVLGVRGLNRKEGDDDNDIYTKLVHRHYVKTTGNFIKKIHEADGDSLALLLYSNTNFQTDNIYPRDSSTYYRISSSPSTFNKNIVNYVLDSLGRVLDSISIVCRHNYILQGYRPFEIVSRDTIITTLFIKNLYHQLDDSFDFQFYLLTTDLDFSYVDTFNITEVLQAKNQFSIYNYYADKEVIILFMQNEPELFQWEYYFLIFDYQGNLLDSVDLNDINPYCRIKRISKDEFLIAGSTLEDEDRNYKLVFYKKKLGEKKRLIREFEVVENQRPFYCQEIHLMDNNDIVLIANFRGQFLDTKYTTLKYPVIIRFAAEDIWGSVNTKDPKPNMGNILDLYPNPAKNTLRISFQSGFSGIISLIDVMGRRVLVQSVENSHSVNLNISGLKKGLYFMHAFDTKRKLVFAPERVFKE